MAASWLTLHPPSYACEPSNRYQLAEIVVKQTHQLRHKYPDIASKM